MGRHNHLSEFERGEIDGSGAAGVDPKMIATELGHDKRTVQKYLKNKQAYDQKYPGG